MSKSENVLVAVGASPAPKLPRQNYDNIVTKYNIAVGMPPAIMTDAAFFNLTIDEGAPPDYHPPHIYGFLKGGYSYSSPSSLQEIVNVFSMDDDIEIVNTDVLVKKAATGAEFVDHGHSEAVPDCSFFIRDSLIDKIRFEDSAQMFNKVLQSLVSEGKKIYHIGEPLLTAEIS